MNESVARFEVATEALTEAGRSREIYKAFHSAHEGFAVLKEEVDELWDEVKKREFDRTKMRAEAVQIAAMAIRFAVEVTTK